MRFKAGFSYQFKTYLKALGWFYVWAIAGIVILPTLITVVLGQAQHYTLSDALPGGLTSIVLGIFLVVYGAITYDGFKLFIQNGIGRKTYFWSKTAVLGVIVLVGEVINVLYGWLYENVITSRHSGTMVFFDLYGKCFHNQVADRLAVVVITILFIGCFLATSMAVGSILGLFSRRVQIILIVGIPILLFIILTVLISVNTTSSLKLTWIYDALTFMVGYHKQAQGYLNPFAPMISGTLYILIMLGISYGFTLKLRVPR
ncbi:hypothetical protein [Secundilactobacillus paracollinoides]|uniref:Uncharacterized protein n=1 Tax=Secundilactobacillus paracollinoides TaxID=240427 RepID=A0A1B2IZU1_9LACO|nr:hypothetical protein [Secundilactobacillus paracollinoides]ANZ61696.1 hypothetical protein AYR61_10215 [Secundilactobacillus paracollinoides]ANZ67614.1 hypothetical protein AYR63_10960 [Secundilactobacillus paracollinoides]